jgi:hypothetical protein
LGKKFDGADICELVGLFILNHLGKRFGKENIGFDRDDGMAIISIEKSYTKFSSNLT